MNEQSTALEYQGTISILDQGVLDLPNHLRQLSRYQLNGWSLHALSWIRVHLVAT
jgi:hypothetical protein